MGNLIDIQAQIEKLQRQAADIKSREFDKTIKEILTKMQAFGITLEDLQLAMGKSIKARRRLKAKAAPAKKIDTKRAGRKMAGKTGAKVPAKYRGPNGEAWSGRGLTPRWLATLVAAGKSKESFAVTGGAR